ncbi:hypothetical protein GGX14DRAFT_408857 [Mycena pura]|uniref:Uncharacterized protein n=1 Tax=Mycena pura TaxID=153505 RepID=A0AAD6UM15_9AGAR|nr:hypothetical protein GGX14DRAFT_408857 [Mycena pura]
MLEDTKSDTRSDTGKAIREINVVRSPSLIISPPFQRHMPPAPAQGAVLYSTRSCYTRKHWHMIYARVFTPWTASRTRAAVVDLGEPIAQSYTPQALHTRVPAGERRHTLVRVGLCRWRGVSALLHPVGGRRLVLGRILRDQHVRAERAALREVEPARVAQRAEQ